MDADFARKHGEQFLKDWEQRTHCEEPEVHGTSGESPEDEADVLDDADNEDRIEGPRFSEFRTVEKGFELIMDLPGNR